jgi:hypothetical protein
MRPIWLSFWGRFDLGPIWLGTIWLEIEIFSRKTKDNYSLLSIKDSKHKLNSFKSTTSYTRNSQILHTTFVKNSDESLDSKR